MQRDNNIENKLREMEGMEQPDMSHLDEHWQKMSAMLLTPGVPVKKIWPKWMLNILAVSTTVVLISAAAWYLYSKNSASVHEAPVANKALVKPTTVDQNAGAAASVTVTDTTPVIPANKPISINTSLINMGDSEGTEWTEEDSLLGTIKLNVKDCLTCPGKTDSLAKKDTVIMNAASGLTKLQLLFTQLAKEEQHFIINNSRDTLLQCKEGTALLIPGNSLGGMNGIDITVKEFYTMSDIVLNQLNTASNKSQLETGGMLYLEANYKGRELQEMKRPLTLFMPDTSSRMEGMQLFSGRTGNSVAPTKTEESSGYPLMDTARNDASSYINWVPQSQYFVRRQLVTQVKVLNIVDEPYKMKERKKGTIGYFLYSEDMDVDKDSLVQMLKAKYGYYKVKLRPDFRNNFYFETSKAFSSEYGRKIGDSMWMDKEVADKYRITGTATRQIMRDQWYNSRLFGGITINLLNRSATPAPKATNGFFVERQQENTHNISAEKVVKEINGRYGVNISQLGWINCDRFYTDSRRKINFKVDIGNNAASYYTMLVFENIRSMMTGYANGNEVIFQNIPINEPVKVISIGINQKGETVYAVTHTTTSEAGLKGLQFETTSAPGLKTALSRYDK